MNEILKRRVCFNGRDCDILRAFLYVTNYYDLWLQDVGTQKFTDVCTVTDSELPVGDHVRLIREAYVGLLVDAGYATPTGEIIELEKYGRLHYCEVPEIEPASLITGYRSAEKEATIGIEERECDAGEVFER